jgi:hypothetical protein
MKFKKGDKIICIDDTNTPSLKLYNEYIFFGYHVNSNDIVVRTNGWWYPLLDAKRFISLNEYRLLKIKKLKNEIQRRI